MKLFENVLAQSSKLSLKPHLTILDASLDYEINFVANSLLDKSSWTMFFVRCSVGRYISLCLMCNLSES